MKCAGDEVEAMGEPTDIFGAGKMDNEEAIGKEGAITGDGIGKDNGGNAGSKRFSWVGRARFGEFSLISIGEPWRLGKTAYATDGGVFLA